MTEDFTTEALQYLLDELDPERRAAFSDRLAHDPVAAEALKNCADSLAKFALDTAPPATLSDQDRRAEIAAILATTLATTQRPPAGGWASAPLKQWLWPVAAAILLGLNLIQWMVSTRSTGDSAIARPSGDGLEGGVSKIGSTTLSGEKDLARSQGADAHGADSAPQTPEGKLSAQLARLEVLQREYKDLQKARDALNSEYDHAIWQLTRRALAEQGVNRLASMELVDANSFARGDRKGLAKLARDLLTQPGVVAPPVQPPTAVPPAFFGVGASGTPTPTPPPATPPESPYAWSVFDEKENQGFLNLYNLPTVPADQTLQVWVKPIDSQEFRSVGEVPSQFHGKSGAVSYSLPAGVAAPVEILITLEPHTATPPAKPTGNVVLRGP